MSLHITLTHHIKGSLEEVTAYFKEVDKFAQAHPLITSIKKVEGQDNYRVRERMPLVYFPFSYPAKIVTTDTATTMQAKVFGLFHINLKFEWWEEEKGVVKIGEQIEVNGLPLMNGILFRTVINSHREMAQNIRNQVKSKVKDLLL